MAERRRIGVIGAGMVGVCAASYLQRDGHSVFMLDPGVPGEGASFGNAGAFNASSVTPMAMPGIIKKVPGWLRDPLGPLSLRWTYLPAVLPYLIRFIRAGTEEKVHAQARALRPLVGATLSALEPLVKDAGAERLVHQRGHLYVYRSAESLAKDGLAWALRRENGVEVDEFDADELRQLEPTLSREYVRGLLVRENGHTSNPFGLVTALVEHFRRQGGVMIRAAATGFRLDGGKADRDPDRCRRAGRRRRGGRRRGLVEAARRFARRQGAARNRARLSSDDPRPRSDADDPDCRWRRQVRRDTDGHRLAFRRHRRAGRARCAARLAPRPHPSGAGPPNAARPRPRASRGAHLGVDGPSSIAPRTHCRCSGDPVRPLMSYMRSATAMSA